MSTGPSSPRSPRASPAAGAPFTRHVAISTNKPSRAFFNISRKALLEGAERLELSALESAIALAIDTSFLLTRAKMAEIESIETAYVQVRDYHSHHYRQQQHHPGEGGEQQQQPHYMSRKSRMTIILKKTESFREYVQARREEEGEEEEEEEEEY